MVQTVWKGALSFGLVNVPVSLVATTRKTGISFRQLHKEDHSPIRLEKKCRQCAKALRKEDIVRGVEVGKDTFVEVTDEEIEAAEPESTRAIAIAEFVSASAIDPVYRERSYALAPQPGGERAYALLHDALSRRGELAIGRVAIRGDEHLVAIRAGDKLLFADVLHYDEEVRDLGEIESSVAREEVSKEESEIADVLIERMHKDWDPAKFHDRANEAMRDLVSTKMRGEIYQAAPAPAKAPTTDLLAALRATLAREDGKKAEA